MKTYLFDYRYRGEQYSLDLQAESDVDAIDRMEAIQRQPIGYRGELVARVPVPSFNVVGAFRKWFR